MQTSIHSASSGKAWGPTGLHLSEHSGDGLMTQRRPYIAHACPLRQIIDSLLSGGFDQVDSRFGTCHKLISLVFWSVSVVLVGADAPGCVSLHVALLCSFFCAVIVSALLPLVHQFSAPWGSTGLTRVPFQLGLLLTLFSSSSLSFVLYDHGSLH